MSLNIYLSTCLSMFSTPLSTSCVSVPSVYQTILCTYKSTYLSIKQAVSEFRNIYLSAYLSIHLSVCLRLHSLSQPSSHSANIYFKSIWPVKCFDHEQRIAWSPCLFPPLFDDLYIDLFFPAISRGRLKWQADARIYKSCSVCVRQILIRVDGWITKVI